MLYKKAFCSKRKKKNAMELMAQNRKCLLHNSTVAEREI